MIREIVIITTLILLAGVVFGDEETIINETGDLIFLNLTNQTGITNLTDIDNITTPDNINLTSEIEEVNQTAPQVNITPQETPEKPVYTRSIGSVYNPDYQEPQARTFSYSGCGA